jgi:hypothetical protein
MQAYKEMVLEVFTTCELPHTDLLYSVGFPIHREQPLELRSSMGLTFPPRAEVLIPKTQIFLL